MKPIGEMTQAELAAWVQEYLRKQGIPLVLSGGAAVAIYSSGRYVSKDIDLVNARFTNRKKIEKAMIELGFSPTGRHFEHSESDQIVEFPPGPLSVGDDIIVEISEIEFETGILHVLSPTDCVKDRLAHFYHWNDRQCLAQAILVAASHTIDFEEIEKWSKNEGKLTEFNRIKTQLSKRTD